jgi:hypothetical protein
MGHVGLHCCEPITLCTRDSSLVATIHDHEQQLMEVSAVDLQACTSFRRNSARCSRLCTRHRLVKNPCTVVGISRDTLLSVYALWTKTGWCAVRSQVQSILAQQVPGDAPSQLIRKSTSRATVRTVRGAPSGSLPLVGAHGNASTEYELDASGQKVIIVAATLSL